MLREPGKGKGSSKFKDLRQQKFGRWLVIAQAPNKNGLVYWRCRCECGTEKAIRTCNLKSGMSKSCGCWNTEVAHQIEHGMTNSSEYSSWSGMKERCLNPNNPSYPRYGGRGITICQKWIDSFEKFYADMGPSGGLSIERNDVNGNYEPSNCKWLPMDLQARNKRSNRKIVAFGEEKLLVDWAQSLGISISLLHYHLKAGKTIEQIVQDYHPSKVRCVCGTWFFPARKWQQYCSDKCKEREHSKRRYGTTVSVK